VEETKDVTRQGEARGLKGFSPAANDAGQGDTRIKECNGTALLGAGDEEELRICDEVVLARTGDASQLVLSGFGLFLSKKEERLVIRKGKDILYEFPFYRLNELTLVSKGISLSSDLIMELCARGIHINFLGGLGKPYAKITAPALSATIQARREQFKALEDRRGVELSKRMVSGKLKNQRGLLLYFAKYIKQTDAGRFSLVNQAARNLKELYRQVLKVEGDQIVQVRNTILGIEGTASRVYWSAIQHVIGDKTDFPGRVRRGAKDAVNSLLNYGYGMLYSQVWGAVVTAGLEPFAGFLHADRAGKPSLILDLVEEFRQPVVDRTVLAHVNRGEPIHMENGILSPETRKVFSEKILERLESKERYQGKIYQIRSIIQIQARNVASYLKGEKTYRPFSFKW